MQSLESVGSSASIRGGILDSIITPPSSATLPPSELAALQVPHAQRPLKQSSSLYNFTPGESDAANMQSVNDSTSAFSTQQMSPAAAAGRQQSLNSLASSAATGTQQAAGLHHSPSATALPQTLAAPSGNLPTTTALKAVHDVKSTVVQTELPSGPGSRNATSSDVGRMSSQASSTSSLRAVPRRNSVPQFPMTSAKALLFQAAALTDYEQGEM